MTPPRAPNRLSWAVAGRLAGRVFAGFMLVLLAALLAWPEEHSHSIRCQLERLYARMEAFAPSRSSFRIPRCDPRRGPIEESPLPWLARRWRTECYRDASLSLLPELLGL